MHLKHMTDMELLRIVVGAKAAFSLYEGRLAPLFIGEADKEPHPRLAAAFELTKRLLEEELPRGESLCTSRLTKSYLRAYFMGQHYESFVLICLDNQHRVIRIEELFRGTIDGAMIHPREVVKHALKYHAAACIFVHNHPSGVSEPSQADIGITRRLKSALELVDIRTLDHLIVGDEVVSMAERGML